LGSGRQPGRVLRLKAENRRNSRNSLIITVIIKNNKQKTLPEADRV